MVIYTLTVTNFYKGDIDGEIGTSTKQALTDFDAMIFPRKRGHVGVRG